MNGILRTIDLITVWYISCSVNTTRGLHSARMTVASLALKSGLMTTTEALIRRQAWVISMISGPL